MCSSDLQAGAAQTVQMSLVQEVLADGQHPVQTGPLEYDPHMSSHFVYLADYIESKYFAAAAARRDQGGEYFEKRCLSGAVRSQEAEDFTFANG